MELYRTKSSVEIMKGARLQLTEAQAAPRLNNLKPLTGGVYEVKTPVSFKKGETIGLEPSAAKSYDVQYDPVKKKLA